LCKASSFYARTYEPFGQIIPVHVVSLETRILARFLAEAIWTGAERGQRQYQTLIRQDERTWWAFAPASPDGINDYFSYYVHRINAAGWYPTGEFPVGADFSGVDLLGVNPTDTFLSDVRYDFARLDEASFGRRGWMLSR
jgi:hypothetical protein